MLRVFPWVASGDGSGADTGFGNKHLSWLGTALNYAMHAFFVLVFCWFLIALIRYVISASPENKLPRAMAMFIGALVVIGAQASGRSYSDFIINSLGNSRSATFRLFGAVVPAAAGMGLGYYMTRGIKRSNELTFRLMIMVGTLCITQFALMYAVALNNSGSQKIVGKPITPNVAFAAGLGLVFVFTYGIKDEKAKRKMAPHVTGGTSAQHHNGGAFDRLRSLANRTNPRTVNTPSERGAPVIPGYTPPPPAHESDVRR